MMLKHILLLYATVLTVFVTQFFVIQPVIDDVYQKELQEDFARDTAGVFLYLKELKLRMTPAEWEDMLLSSNRMSNVPVVAKPLTEWSFSAEAKAALNSNQVWFDNSAEDSEFLRMFKFIDPNTVARIGPVDTTADAQRAAIIEVLTLPAMLALALLGWVLWLQFRLQKLESVSVALSEGKLFSRANTGLLAVGKINQTFNVMAERLERMIQSHRHLTNAVSHELRSPIGRIRFQLEMLDNATESNKRKAYALGIEEDLEDMDFLVEELLDYARMERAGNDITRQSFDIKGWLEEQQSRLVLEVKTPICIEDMSDSPIVTADPKMLARLLRNVVCNADRYSRSVIFIGFKANNRFYSLWVDDDGPGIPEEHRERVFEAFTVLDISRNKKRSGYGLGLSIVAQIARQHGGEVNITSSPFGGARVITSWPI